MGRGAGSGVPGSPRAFYKGPMAVHTVVDPETLATFVGRHPEAGAFRAAEGVPEGSIHTTYRIHADRGVFYLRLTEGLEADDVAFELALLDHLAARSFPSPRPLHPAEGPFPGRLAGRPAVLFAGIPGAPAATIGADHAAAVGEGLARLHRASDGFERRRPNPYGPDIVGPWLDALGAHGALPPEVEAALPALAAALDASAGFAAALPPEAVGVVHADLFVDNVLWEGGRLSGFLDFEMACTAPRVLDLAVALLVWCWDGAALDPVRSRALLGGYRAVRPLGPEEVAALHDAARFAAVRYAVTRVRDFLLSDLPPDRLVRKDWRRFRDRLTFLEAVGPAGLRALTA